MVCQRLAFEERFAEGRISYRHAGVNEFSHLPRSNLGMLAGEKHDG